MAKKKNKKPRHIKRFSRRILVAFFLFLQLLILACVGFLITALQNVWWSFGFITVALWAINFIVVVRILYKHGDPEIKIPWIVVLLSMPVVGILFYEVFRQRSLTKKEKKVLEKIKTNQVPYFLKGKAAHLSEEDPYYQPMAILESTTDYSMFEQSKLTYFKNGEDFFPDFLEKLRNAKQFIFLEFFIIHPGKIWDEIHEILVQKAKEGVEVRLLYDDFGCYSSLPSQYYEDLRDEGIDCYPFNRAGFLLLGVYNNRDHRKIAVIDYDYAYTGGANLADEYANIIERFGYWKDTMIRIEGKGISSLLALFLLNYDLSKRSISDYSKFLSHEYPAFENEGALFSFGTGPEMLYSLRVGEINYLSLIQCARKKIYISTPYFVPSNELLQALELAALRGVEVHLVLPGIPDKKIPYLLAKYYIPHVLAAGVHVYFYTPGFNHMKTVLVDDQLAFVGSINMDFRSFVHNFECGTTILRSPILKDIEADFKEMLDASEELPKDFSLTTIQKVCCALLSIFIPLL